jgi:hypothetical protein
LYSYFSKIFLSAPAPRRTCSSLGDWLPQLALSQFPSRTTRRAGCPRGRRCLRCMAGRARRAASLSLCRVRGRSGSQLPRRCPLARSCSGDRVYTAAGARPPLPNKWHWDRARRHRDPRSRRIHCHRSTSRSCWHPLLRTYSEHTGYIQRQCPGSRCHAHRESTLTYSPRLTCTLTTSSRFLLDKDHRCSLPNSGCRQEAVLRANSPRTVEG